MKYLQNPRHGIALLVLVVLRPVASKLVRILEAALLVASDA